MFLSVHWLRFLCKIMYLDCCIRLNRPFCKQIRPYIGELLGEKLNVRVSNLCSRYSRECLCRAWGGTVSHRELCGQRHPPPRTFGAKRHAPSFPAGKILEIAAGLQGLLLRSGVCSRRLRGARVCWSNRSQSWGFRALNIA